MSSKNFPLSQHTRCENGTHDQKFVWARNISHTQDQWFKIIIRTANQDFLKINSLEEKDAFVPPR